MNAVAVLVCVAALGVDHNWRTTEEGQLEYVLQVEATFVPALEQGQAITSKLPPTARQVHRLCLRMGSGDVRKQRQRGLQLPSLASEAERAANPGADVPVCLVVNAKGESLESTDVSHGWQPAGRDQVDYYVQLSPQLLASLSDGDEVYMNIYPEAGAIRQFNIISGDKLLPRETGREPAEAPVVAVAAQNASIYGPAAGGAAEDARGQGVPDAEGPLAESAANEPPLIQPAPRRWNLSDTRREEPAADDDTGAGNEGPAARPGLFGSQPRRPATTLQVPSTPRSDFGVPEFDRSQFSRGRESEAQPETTEPAVENRYSASSTENPRTAPRLKGQSESRIDSKVAFTGAEQYSEDEPAERVASLDTKNTGTTKAETGPKTKSTETDAEHVVQTPPWTPYSYWFFLTFCALALSLGGNLYLGWTAAEFYSRYRMAVERVRGTGRT